MRFKIEEEASFKTLATGFFSTQAESCTIQTVPEAWHKKKGGRSMLPGCPVD